MHISETNMTADTGGRHDMAQPDIIKESGCANICVLLFVRVARTD